MRAGLSRWCVHQVTGKKLLEKGELKRRYTIIPLNKISAKTLNQSVVNAAKSLVRGACPPPRPDSGALLILPMGWLLISQWAGF